MSEYEEFTTEETREVLRNILRDIEQRHFRARFERDRSIAIIKAIEDRGPGGISQQVGNKSLLSQRATQQRQIRDSHQLDMLVLEADMERVKAELEALPAEAAEDDAADEPRPEAE